MDPMQGGQKREPSATSINDEMLNTLALYLGPKYRDRTVAALAKLPNYDKLPVALRGSTAEAFERRFSFYIASEQEEPYLETLQLVSYLEPYPEFKQVIREMRLECFTHDSLPQAMKARPEYFSPTMVQLFEKAWEEARPEVILNHLAPYLDEN